MLLLWTKEIQELSDVTGFLPIITTFTTALSMSHSLQGLCHFMPTIRGEVLPSNFTAETER